MLKLILRLLLGVATTAILFAAANRLVQVKYDLTLLQWITGKCTFNLESSNSQTKLILVDATKFSNYFNEFTKCNGGVNFMEDVNLGEQRQVARVITFVLTDAKQSRTISMVKDQGKVELYSVSSAFDTKKNAGFIYLSINMDSVEPEITDRFLVDILRSEIDRVMYGAADKSLRNRDNLKMSDLGLTYEK